MADRVYTRSEYEHRIRLVLFCTAVLLLTWGIPAARAVPGFYWTQATPSAEFPARNAHTSVVFDGGAGDAIWVLGGAWDLGLLNDAWSSTDGSAWVQANEMFSPRYGHTSVVFNDATGKKMWVIGGYDQFGTVLNDVWYSSDGITWTRATDYAGFSPRYGHSSVVMENKIWVIGGYDDAGSVLNDAWYSEDGITWTRATDNAGFPPRYGHSSVVLKQGQKDIIWVIGGYDNAAVFNDAWYSEDGITWTLATDNAGFSARYGHSSVVHRTGRRNFIWVIGGYDTAAVFNDAWYSEDGITWTLATDNAGFSPRYGHSSVVVRHGLKETILVIGGYDDTGNSVNDLWYSDDGSSWTQVTGGAEFSPRYGHSSVAFNDGTGNNLWVIGGTDGLGNYYNDVWNSANGAGWNPVTFPPRYSHSSVAFDDGTGEKMWVIGGSGSSGLFNDIWYSTDGAAWSRATDSAAFPERFGHSSVAFDGRMWVMGGSGFSGLLNDVWSSPDGVSWTPATLSAGFPARSSHTSVAFDDGTGEKVWVIGGNGDSGLLNDVWYSSDGGAWTQATDSAAFPRRQFHTSIVFENTMWVIGGYGDSGVLKDVWYSTDGATWTQATASAAFPARNSHTSVVFGNAMWVMGGSEPSNANDVWSSPSLPAPTVTAIDPATGINTGSVSITDLAGTGFMDWTAIHLAKAGQDDIAAESVTVVSPNKITCILPIGGAMPGVWDVVVTNPDLQSGTYTGGFTVTAPAPTVNGINVSHGHTTGAAFIENLSGTGFFNGITVNLTLAGEPNITATNVNVVSPTRISCSFDLVGRATGRYDVVVTNKDGQFATLADGFQVMLPPPWVNTVSPIEGTNTGLVAMTINGEYFVGNALEKPTVRLEFGRQSNITATSVVVISPTQITCNFDLTGVPEGTWYINVINPDGQSSLDNNNLFQFVVHAAQAAPLAPPSGPSGGGGGGGIGYTSSAPKSAPEAVQPEQQPESEASSATDTGQTAELQTDPGGVVTQETVLRSTDALAEVSIPTGIVAKDATGAPLTSMIIAALPGSAVPADTGGSAFSFAGSAYELGPDGATFSPAITLTFTVPEAEEGMEYTIRMLDPATTAWLDLPTTYHPESGTVTAEVSHFCCFALFARVPVTPTATASALLTTTGEKTSSIPPRTAMHIFSGMILWAGNQGIRYPLVIPAMVILVVGIFLYRRKRQRGRRKRLPEKQTTQPRFP